MSSIVPDMPLVIMPTGKPMRREDLIYIAKNSEKYVVFPKIEGTRYLLIHDSLNSLFMCKNSALNKKVGIISACDFVMDGILKGNTFYVRDEYEHCKGNFGERSKALKKLIECTTLEGFDLVISNSFSCEDLRKGGMALPKWALEGLIFIPTNWIPGYNECSGWFEWNRSNSINLGTELDDEYVYIYSLKNGDPFLHAKIDRSMEATKEIIEFMKLYEVSDIEEIPTFLNGFAKLGPTILKFGYKRAYNAYYPKGVCRDLVLPDFEEDVDRVKEAMRVRIELEDIVKELKEYHMCITGKKATIYSRQSMCGPVISTPFEIDRVLRND